MASKSSPGISTKSLTTAPSNSSVFFTKNNQMPLNKYLLVLDYILLKIKVYFALSTVNFQMIVKNRLIYFLT
jgi:hypothetical protein